MPEIKAYSRETKGPSLIIISPEKERNKENKIFRPSLDK